MKVFLLILGGWAVLSVLFMTFVWPTIVNQINEDYPLDTREVPVRLKKHTNGETDELRDRHYW